MVIRPIVTLYFISKQSARLGMIAAFTSFFALTVGLLTDARRVEIFGATAAYTAVLVVFVSGNLAVGPTTHPTIFTECVEVVKLSDLCGSSVVLSMP